MIPELRELHIIVYLHFHANDSGHKIHVMRANLITCRSEYRRSQIWCSKYMWFTELGLKMTGISQTSTSVL